MTVRHLSLWEMLVWTYRDQRAHALLSRPWDWMRFFLAVEEANDPDTPRPEVHPDAAALHAAVLEMGEGEAMLLVEHARLDSQPVPATATPTPHPTCTDRTRAAGRWGWHETGGRRLDYLILTAEETVEMRERGERVGKRGYRVTGLEPVKTPVEYCPIDWEPDPVWREYTNIVYAEWLAAMVRLNTMVRDEVSFRAHHVSCLGVTPQPVPPFDVEKHDARAYEPRRPVVTTREVPGALVSPDGGETWFRRWCRARVT